MINLELGSFLKKITINGKVDLHSHSTASDGSLSPEEVLILAKNNQLDYFALTDHDTTKGINQIINEPILIPGVELSVIFEDQEVHLLAYFEGHDIDGLSEFLEEQRITRRQRNLDLIYRLQQLGIPIPDDELEPSVEQPVTGRVKTARWLLDNNYVKSINQAFDEYLAAGKPAYVPRQRVLLEFAIELIEKSNGFPVIAHPHQYGWCHSQQLLNLKIKHLTQIAPMGIEVYHSDATLKQQKMVLSVAEKLNLSYTAGSDFHGINKENHQLYTDKHNPKNFYGKK